MYAPRALTGLPYEKRCKKGYSGDAYEESAEQNQSFPGNGHAETANAVVRGSVPHTITERAGNLECCAQQRGSESDPRGCERDLVDYRA